MTPTPHRPQTSPPPARRVTTRPSCAPYASPLLFLLPAWGGFRLLLSLSVTVLRKASAYTRYIICCAPDYPPPLIEKNRSRLSSWAAHWLPAPLMTAAHTTSSFTSMFLPTFLEMAPIVGPLPLYASPARTPTTRAIYQKIILPAGLTNYALVAFASKSPPHHVTPISPPPGCLLAPYPSEPDAPIYWGGELLEEPSLMVPKTSSARINENTGVV